MSELSAPSAPNRPATGVLRRPRPGSSPSGLATARLRWRAFDRRHLVAIVAAGLVAVIVVQTVHRARAQITALGTRIDIVVAAGDLEAGTVVQQNDLVVRSWPIGLLPSTATFSHPDAVVGRSVRDTIHLGEPVSDARLVSGMADLEPSERAVTIPQPLAPPPLELGDVVELVGVRAFRSDEAAVFGPATVVLGACRVIDVRDTGITTACETSVALDVVGLMATGAVEVLRMS